jgi:Mg-chelatase subunit ChlD
VQLTGNTQRVIDAIGNAWPSGGTPTLSALVGGIDYADRVRASDPSIPVVVVLVTDG